MVGSEMIANNITNNKINKPIGTTFSDNGFWFVWQAEDMDKEGIYAKIADKDFLISGGECTSDTDCTDP